jgi:sterol desaturase/sphingolipid hydroxylase (fatty acid hydroxylase superfamily)
LWASHENHHTSNSFNWSVALRQTWTPFLAAPFWLPLPLLGFEPLMVLSVQTASLLYQAFQHTELVGRLGPLGLILNAPGHHRVHHGVEPECWDKNFGGVLIIWDRLFGSFQVARPAAYGVAGERRSANPVAIAFQSWRMLIIDILRSRSPRHALGYLLRPPGWRPTNHSS